ncbi:MAG TPA: four helix bundle protein [Gemmatimonadaceae bacterium]|nr:four helix bundle protein [Gemmatimonadaceae bacterium]
MRVHVSEGCCNAGPLEPGSLVADFKRLRVWRKAHALALNVDRASVKIRGQRYAALRNQLVRAAMSIPANIVEGRAQPTERNFGRFLGYALGSAAELEYHLIVARDVRALSDSEFISLLSQLIEVRKMLHGLIAHLKNGLTTAPRDDPSESSAALS